jgi:hypothetical protein
MAADFRPNAGEQGQSSVISLKLQVKSPGKQGEMGFPDPESSTAGPCS